MGQSDALSRRPNHIPDRDKDNEEMMLLPDMLFIRQIDIMTYDIIVKVMTRDDFLNKTIVALMEKGTLLIRSNLRAWELHEGLLFFNN
jgi:hypothetical protein